MTPITLNDKTAVKIKAKLIWQSDKTNLYDCEGSRVWIPKKLSYYDENEKTLIIEEWFYNKLVKEKKL